MDALVLALAPGFAAGFAVQRLLEILDSILGWGLGKERWSDAARLKAFVLAIISLAVGVGIAASTGIRVLKPLGASAADNWDIVITALFISAGTEGANSILKYLGYKKDEQKTETAQKVQALAASST